MGARFAAIVEEGKTKTCDGKFIGLWDTRACVTGLGFTPVITTTDFSAFSNLRSSIAHTVQRLRCARVGE